MCIQVFFFCIWYYWKRGRKNQLQIDYKSIYKTVITWIHCPTRKPRFLFLCFSNFIIDLVLLQLFIFVCRLQEQNTILNFFYLGHPIKISTMCAKQPFHFGCLLFGRHLIYFPKVFSCSKISTRLKSLIRNIELIYSILVLNILLYSFDGFDCCYFLQFESNHIVSLLQKFPNYSLLLNHQTIPPLAEFCLVPFV